METIQLSMQKFFSNFSALDFLEKNKDSIALSSVAALGWVLYQHLSSSSRQIIGSHLATRELFSKNKYFFLPGEEEKMRGELDRLQGEVNDLWKNAMKVEPKSILKQAGLRKKTVRFSDPLDEVKELVQLKDRPLLLEEDLTALAKTKKKALSKEIF